MWNKKAIKIVIGIVVVPFVIISLIFWSSVAVGVYQEMTNDVETEREQVYIEEQEPEVVEKEEIKDEDVSDEYLEQSKSRRLQEIKEIVEMTAEDCFEGFEYDTTTHEESNTVTVTIYVTINDVAMAIKDGSWNELVNVMTNVSSQMKRATDEIGYSDVNICLAIGNKDEKDKVFLGVINGSVIYNIADELN